MNMAQQFGGFQAQQYGGFQLAQPGFPSFNPRMYNQLLFQRLDEQLQMSRTSGLNGGSYSSLAVSESWRHLASNMGSGVGQQTTDSQQNFWAMFQTQGLQWRTSWPPAGSVNSHLFSPNQYYGQLRLGFHLAQESVQSPVQWPDQGNNQGQVCEFQPPAEQSYHAENETFQNMFQSGSNYNDKSRDMSGFFPPTTSGCFATDPPASGQAVNQLHHNRISAQNSSITNQQFRDTNQQSFYPTYSVSSVQTAEHDCRQVPFSASASSGYQSSGYEDSIYYSCSTSVPVYSSTRSPHEARLSEEVSSEPCVRNDLYSKKKSPSENTQRGRSTKNSSKKPEQSRWSKGVNQDSYMTTQGLHYREHLNDSSSPLAYSSLLSGQNSNFVASDTNRASVNENIHLKLHGRRVDPNNTLACNDAGQVGTRDWSSASAIDKCPENSVSADVLSTEPLQSGHEQRSLDKSRVEPAGKAEKRKEEKSNSHFERTITNSRSAEERLTDVTTTCSVRGSPNHFDRNVQTVSKTDSRSNYCVLKKDVTKVNKKKNSILKRLLDQTERKHFRSHENMERRAERLLGTHAQITSWTRTRPDTATDSGNDASTYTKTSSAMHSSCQCARNPLCCQFHNPLQSPAKHTMSDAMSVCDPHRHSVSPVNEKRNDYCLPDSGAECDGESIWNLLEKDVEVMKRTYENSAVDSSDHHDSQQTALVKNLKKTTDLVTANLQIDSDAKHSDIQTLDTQSLVFAASSFSGGIGQIRDNASTSDTMDREFSTGSVDNKHIDYYHTCVNCKKTYNNYLELNAHLSVHLKFETDERSNIGKRGDCVTDDRSNKGKRGDCVTDNRSNKGKRDDCVTDDRCNKEKRSDYVTDDRSNKEKRGDCVTDDRSNKEKRSDYVTDDRSNKEKRSDYVTDDGSNKEKRGDYVHTLDRKEDGHSATLSHELKENTTLFSPNKQIADEQAAQNCFVFDESSVCNRYDMESTHCDGGTSSQDATSGKPGGGKCVLKGGGKRQDSYPVLCAVEGVGNGDLDTSSSPTCYSLAHSQSVSVGENDYIQQTSASKVLSARQKSLIPSEPPGGLKRKNVDSVVNTGKKSKHQDHVICSVHEKELDCEDDIDLPVIYENRSNRCELQSDSLKQNGLLKLNSCVGKHKRRISESEYQKPSGINVHNMPCSNKQKQKHRPDSSRVCMNKTKISAGIVSSTYKNHDCLESYASEKQQPLNSSRTSHQVETKRTAGAPESTFPENQRVKPLKIVKKSINTPHTTYAIKNNRHEMDEQSSNSLKVQKGKVPGQEPDTASSQTKMDSEAKCASVLDASSESHHDTECRAVSDTQKKPCSSHWNLDGDREKNCCSANTVYLNHKIVQPESRPSITTASSGVEKCGQFVAKSGKAKRIVNSLRKIFNNNALLLGNKSLKEDGLNKNDSTNMNLVQENKRKMCEKVIESGYKETESSNIHLPKKMAEGVRNDTVYCVNENSGDARNGSDRGSAFAQSECKKVCDGVSLETGIAFEGPLMGQKKCRTDGNISVKCTPNDNSCQQTNEYTDLIFCVKCMTVFTKREVYDEHGCCRKVSAEESGDGKRDRTEKQRDQSEVGNEKIKTNRCFKEDASSDGGSSDDVEEHHRKKRDGLKLKMVPKTKLSKMDKKKKRKRILSTQKSEKELNLRSSSDKKKNTCDQTVFTCDHCDQTYASRGGLLFHWQVVHKKRVC